MNLSRPSHDTKVILYRSWEMIDQVGRVTKPSTSRSVIPRVQKLPLILRKPQWVRFADQYYSIDQEGLYRFWNWGKVRYSNDQDLPELIDQRKEYSSIILYKNDLVALLSSLMLIHVHGYNHEKLSYAVQLAKAKQAGLSLTCGYISLFNCRLFKTLGIKARRVAGLRIEGQYNTYDNGHTLNEIFWPSLRKWVLVDVDMHQMFRNKKGGTYLNLAEVSERIRRGRDFYLEALTPPGMGGIEMTPNIPDDHLVQLMVEGCFFHPERMKDWYRKMLTVPMVETSQGMCFYCENPEDNARVTRYSGSYKSMSRSEWLKRFYCVER